MQTEPTIYRRYVPRPEEKKEEVKTSPGTVGSGPGPTAGGVSGYSGATGSTGTSGYSGYSGFSGT